MAVTITVAELAAALRVGDSAEETAEVTRLLAYATEAVDKYAPGAPDATQNEAVVRLAAQMFDQPNATRGAYANAMRNSGAARILMPYRIHRAGSTEDAIAVAQGAVGTTGNPVVDVQVSSGDLVITFNDGTTETHTLPAGMSGDGTDQTARDAATAAQTAADAAQTDIDEHETNHPTGADSTARVAAGTAQAAADTAQADATTGIANAATAQVAANAAQTTATAAQGEIDQHEQNHPDGSTDQTARDAATAAQTTADGAITEIKSHEADTHNTDGTARDAAAAAQSTANSAATSAGTAQTTANAAQATADAKIDADATNALIAAHTLQHNAHHTPPHVGEGGGVVNIINGRLPGPAVAIRAGWNQSQTHAPSIFTRSNNHPIDGAAAGMSDGLALPPFPPALSTDTTLYLHLWLAGTPDFAAIRSNADTNPAEITAMFPDSLSGPLTVDGVAGTVYASNVRLASMEGVVYDVLIAGAEIATVTDTTRYAATFGLLTDLAAGTWANYTSGLDAGEIFKHGAFGVATAAGRDKLMIPTTGVYSVKAMVVGVIDVGASTDRAWLETRLVRTRGGVEVAQAPVGVLGAMPVTSWARRRGH